MAENQENSSKILPISSSENRDSFFSDAEAFEGDEEFYEEIEAPKFVDFTVPDHFCPDDRYWFCHRVGCDQKHEEEMDSEAIYKKFVLRVMAARSPNVRPRKILDRNASRKCPLSAPPKPSKPRLSKMDLISSFSKKTVDDEEKVVRPIPKPRPTPVTKSKPIAAKYLTTPRNKNCTQNENSFLSVQNPKAINTEVPKSRMVAKALVFHSPKKKTVKVKTSVELRTPVSKLCQGMHKLEITSKKPSKSLSKSCSSRDLRCRRVPEETLSKSGKSIKCKINGKLSQQKASKNEENQEIKQQEFELQKSTHEEKCLEQEVSGDGNANVNNLSERERDENEFLDADNDKENAADTDGNANVNNSSEGERDENEFLDGDNDKENAAATDENRMHNENPKQNGRKVLAMNDQSGQVRKKVTQAQDRNLKESLISCSSTVVKLKKPKATNPKPFRLRTDERGILKETKLERRPEHVAPQTQSVTLSSTLLLSGKSQMKKQGNDNNNNNIQGPPIPKGPESKKHRDGNAMQRLEKFRKTSSPLQKRCIRPRGLVSTKKELTPFLIPGQKLEVIHENSPEVLELKVRKANNAPPGDDAAAWSSLHGRRPITVATPHVPTRTCPKKLK
ncbi:hypothetical protein PHJA_001012200 [Phtheirospermum japonicum]|uniref:Uncharacterized protein n=1 Tax=Phtheirospermum japonicum TaxID=374723 RepID=A0A830BZQ2_9LAMI|nr:hypothetical protein PHJA_001012200 [Phtheirospermum japonicum]